MWMKIERDQRRFRQIVRGRIRKNLRKYVTHGEMIGRKGRDLVSIPVPQLDIPHFRYGDNGNGGVGQGDGEEGQPLGKGGQPQGGAGSAGSDPGDGHLMEVDVSLEDYRVVDGVKRPFRIRQATAMFTAVVQLTEVTHNGAIDDAMFRKPQ